MKFLKRTLKVGLALMLSMALPALVFANTGDATTPGGDSEITQDLIDLVIIGIKGLNMFLWPILIMIGDLMDSDLIMGPGMDERLRELWVQVRNLVNMGFVLVLLAIAFYNVLGIGGGEGDLAMKTALPKLILGLVLVNFTLPIGRVIIDVTNIATHAAFGLPEVSGQFDFTETEADFEKRMCYKKYDASENENGEPSHVMWTSENMEGQMYVQAFCEFNEVTQDDGTKIKEFTGNLNDFAKVNYFTELNANNLGLIMAVNNQSLTQVMQFNENKVTRWEDITVSLLFALIMYIIFAISYIALAVLLFTRIIVLWTALVLSPLGVLIYVVPQIKEWMGGGGDIQQKVIKHLMSPIIVGLSYSLGYMLILAWDQDGRGNLSAADAQLGELMTADFLLSGINDLTDLMIAMLSVVIIWVGVFAAAEGTIAETATNAIKGFGEKIGGALAKAPLTIPTVPIGDPDDPNSRVSPLAVAKLANQGLYQLETGAVQGQTDRLMKANPEVAKWLGYNSGGATGDPKAGAQKIKDATSALKAGRGEISQEDLRNIAVGLYDTVKGTPELAKDEKLMGQVERLMRQETLTPDDLKELQGIAKRSEVQKAIAGTGLAGAEAGARTFANNASLTIKPKEEPKPADDKAQPEVKKDDKAAPAEDLPSFELTLPAEINGGSMKMKTPKALIDAAEAYKKEQTPESLSALKTEVQRFKTIADKKAGEQLLKDKPESKLKPEDVKAIQDIWKSIPDEFKK